MKLAKFLFLIPLFFLAQNVMGQRLELGLFLGGSNYQGDLASSQYKVVVKQINVAFGGYLKYHFNESWALKLQVLSTELEADDANSSIQAIKQRNLRFFSPLLDASLRMEWHFLNSFDSRFRTVSPFFEAGGSFFTFEPQAEYNGRTYDLQPLSTEGQGLTAYPERSTYELYNYSALLGVGIRFYINDDFNISINFAAHQTFTDYLDDVSSTYVDYQALALEKGVLAADIAYQVDDFLGLEQTSPLPNTVRGNPNAYDYYLYTGISISYNLVNPERGRGGGIGCPTF